MKLDTKFSAIPASQLAPAGTGGQGCGDAALATGAVATCSAVVAGVSSADRGDGDTAGDGTQPVRVAQGRRRQQKGESVSVFSC